MNDWGKNFSERVKDFHDDENGVVAVIFALALLPIVALGAAAVDYARASNNKMNLNDAADVAALAGVRAASNYLAENPRATKAQWSKIAIKQAREIFRANTVGLKDVNVDNLDINVGQEKFKIDLSVNYTAQSKTYFSKFLHVDSLPISNTSSASNSLPGYLQINFIVDISGSMGIGASKLDQKKLQRKYGCTFACHFDYRGRWHSTVAQNKRHKTASLRIDVVRESVKNMVRTFQKNSTFSGQFQVSLYTFSNSLQSIMPASSDLAKAIRKSRQLDISPSNMQGGSNLIHSLKQLANTTSNGGSGLSEHSRKTYTVIVTDGVENSAQIPVRRNGKQNGAVYDRNFKHSWPRYRAHSYEYIQGMEEDGCSVLHKKEHNIIVMLTDYVIDRQNDARYRFIGNTLKPNIQKNMVKCAGGEKNVFNVSSPQDIAAAGKKISSIISNEALRLVR